MGYKALPLLTGQKIGKWTVGDRIKEEKSAIYRCTCECGTAQKVRGSHLINGTSKQCYLCRAKLPRASSRIEVKGVCRKGHIIATVGISPESGSKKSVTCALCRWSTYILRTYGLTVDEYVDLYHIQKGKCAICGKPLIMHRSLGKTTEGVRAEIDHRHTPKRVKPQPEKRDTLRGLLCGGRYAGCNRKLGHVDNAEWLQAAAAYLLDPPAQRLRKGK